MVTLVSTDSISVAWFNAVRAARAVSGNRLFHLVVTIAEPLTEHAGARREVDTLLRSRNLQTIDTVANTIMPAAWARMFGSHDEVVNRYRARYERITRFPKNSWGTYFGRLVAYPIGSGRRPAPVDQLGPIIKALRASRVVAAQYEAAVSTAQEASGNDNDCAPGFGGIVHHPTRGSRGRGGPCLSHVSFQRDGDRVHAVASYRSQYLVERAYGNYLGLGRLLKYVADHADLQPGELTVVTGYAQLDQPVSVLDRTLVSVSQVMRTGS
jgi:hypothetical protein